MGSKNSQPVPPPKGTNSSQAAIGAAPSSVQQSAPVAGIIVAPAATIATPATTAATLAAAAPRADEPVMDLFIKTWSGPIIPIGDVRASDSVAALSRKVAIAAGTGVDEGQLVYAGKSLEDPRTVGDYDIMRSSTLHWVKRGSSGAAAVIASSSSSSSSAIPTASSGSATAATLAASPMMQSVYIPTPGGEATTIFVRTFTGKTLTLDVQTSDPMRMVKIQIETQTNIPPIDQRLVFSGRQLDDNVTLGEYAIARESTIHLARPNPSASRIG